LRQYGCGCALVSHALGSSRGQTWSRRLARPVPIIESRVMSAASFSSLQPSVPEHESNADRARGAEELIDVVRSYLK